MLEKLESRQLLAVVTGDVFQDLNSESIHEPSDAPWSEVQSNVVTSEIGTESRGDEIVINEVYGDTSPYLELRGPKSGVVPDGTYVVVIEEYATGQGDVNQVFDLGGLSFGSNGFMVFVTGDANDAIHPDSSVYESLTDSFAGLPEGIHSSDRDFWSVIGGKAYMLVQSDIAPSITDNIDLDKDGFWDPDGVAANWTTIDSLSMQNFVGGPSYAYGDIVFRDIGIGDINIQTKPGVPIVLSEGAEYAGRIGDSIGSDANDWVGGATQNSGTGLEIVSGFWGPPSPIAFQGLPLDHVGESNFVGGVRGAIFENRVSGDGPARDAIAASGLVVFADTNQNGTLDVIRHVVEPDDLVIRDGSNQTVESMDLRHAVDGVSISLYGSSGRFDDDIRSESQYDFPDRLVNRVFNDGSFDWFGESRKLRFDFFDPVSAVSIDVIGNDGSSSATYGRLDAFNAEGEIIGFVRSRRLIGSARQTISLSASDEDIAYVMAYSDSHLDGSSFGRFDRFTFDQLEPHAVTDDRGEYEIKHLFPGVYDLTVSTDNRGEPLIGAEPRRIEVARYENFEFIDDVRINSAPTIDREAVFEIAENQAVETVLGVIEANDADAQVVRYSIVATSPIRDIDGNVLDPETDFPFSIDELTGELRISANAKVDFEAQSTLRFNVLATDPLGASATMRVIIRLTDMNEAPVVADNPLQIRELAQAGQQVGRIQAFDPDKAMNQTLSFLVTGGTATNLLSVDPTTGIVTVKPGATFDFESPMDLTLELEVRDSAVPAAVTTLTKRIQVVDENDPPLLKTNVITMDENQTGRVERLVVEDADRGQTHLFEIVAGNGINTFIVSRDGILSTRDGVVIDFETQSEYQIDVRIIDTGTPPNSMVQTLTIRVSDVNEAPTLSNQSIAVPEDATGGSLLTQLSVMDPEGAEGEFKLEMIASDFASYFVFDDVTGNLTIAKNTNFDFETKSSGQLVFEVKRIGGESIGVRSTLAVQILDRNEAPMILTQSIAVSESVKAGAQVGRVRATDQDRRDTLTFTIVGGSAEDLFVIDPQSGFITVAPETMLDAETDPERTLEIEVTDSHGLSARQTVNIRVNDVNETPKFAGTLEIPKAISGQYFEYQLPEDFVYDPEGGEFSLAIYGENKLLPSWLRFNPATRTISGTPNPSFIGSTPLTLRAFELGLIDLFNTQSFSIDVERGERPWMKQRNPLDVDDNGIVAPSDALRIINFINENPGGKLPSGTVSSFGGFIDVSGDNMVTPLDAVLVINSLSDRSTRTPGDQIASIDNSINERERTNDAALDELLREESKLF
ncbi:cadherin domain-containing protein [Novipirellula aureliae]|uniref:cadherin domain-containing protein n=1 Tax=Novipirellula aureliae TaxID=2527966 RepID=UPI0018CF991E|nr:cadherin domain-containing protein [Novipirellula aureliae]